MQSPMQTSHSFRIVPDAVGRAAEGSPNDGRAAEGSPMMCRVVSVGSDDGRGGSAAADSDTNESVQSLMEIATQSLTKLSSRHSGTPEGAKAARALRVLQGNTSLGGKMGMETGVENKERAEVADKDEAPDLADDQQDSAGRGSTNSAMVPTPSGASQKSGCVSTVTKDCRRRSSLGMIWGEEPAQPRIRRMPRGMNYWSFITVALVLNVAMVATSSPVIPHKITIVDSRLADVWHCVLGCVVGVCVVITLQIRYMLRCGRLWRNWV